jgi:hypothetical protein
MRYGDCLNCKFTEQQQLVILAAWLPESLSPDSHHHHIVRCTDCDIWWFDDHVIGGFGLPVPSRRDTVMCPCPEDGTDRFEKSMVAVPMPEAECHCTAADVERYAIPIQTRPVP